MSAEHSRPEDTIKKATAFVAIKEAQHIKNLATQEEMLRDSNDLELAAEARKLQKEISSESDRLFSPNHFDEEEWIIGQLQGKKKKKK